MAEWRYRFDLISLPATEEPASRALRESIWAKVIPPTPGAPALARASLYAWRRYFDKSGDDRRCRALAVSHFRARNKEAAPRSEPPGLR